MRRRSTKHHPNIAEIVQFGPAPRIIRSVQLLSRSNKALRDGIQLSEAITGDGAAIFRHAWMDLEGIVSKRIGSRYSGRTRAWLKTKNPDFQRR